MNQLTNDLYQKIVFISNEVKQNFYKNGIVIPVKNKDNSIILGNYTIVKDNDGFFNIKNYCNEIVVEKINLPQTAILLANGLALGKFLDETLLQKDKKYGYAFFEETLYKNKKKNIDLVLAKYSQAKAKREYYKRDIDRSFEKLRKFV